jgi:hypothetical protein
LQRDDRTPLRGAVGGTYKIDLPADKADMSSPCGLGVDLTGEVDLEPPLIATKRRKLPSTSASWV